MKFVVWAVAQNTSAAMTDKAYKPSLDIVYVGGKFVIYHYGESVRDGDIDESYINGFILGWRLANMEQYGSLVREHHVYDDWFVRALNELGNSPPMWSSIKDKLLHTKVIEDD